ncbi:hypothetical protein STEG23_010802 [Scotinomys teguina]
MSERIEDAVPVPSKEPTNKAIANIYSIDMVVASLIVSVAFDRIVDAGDDVSDQLNLSVVTLKDKRDVSSGDPKSSQIDITRTLCILVVYFYIILINENSLTLSRRSKTATTLGSCFEIPPGFYCSTQTVLKRLGNSSAKIKALEKPVKVNYREIQMQIEEFKEGDKELNSPREASVEAEKELALVEKKAQDGSVDCVDPKIDSIWVILPFMHSPTGILMQWDDIILEWILLLNKQSKKLKTYVENI